MSESADFQMSEGSDEDYYNVIKKCRKGNNFILNEMKQEDFISTRFLVDAVFKRISMDKNAELKILDLLPRRGRPRKFENIVLTPLYKTNYNSEIQGHDGLTTVYIVLPEHHDFFKSIPHTQNVDEQ